MAFIYCGNVMELRNTIFIVRSIREFYNDPHVQRELRSVAGEMNNLPTCQEAIEHEEQNVSKFTTVANKLAMQHNFTQEQIESYIFFDKYELYMNPEWGRHFQIGDSFDCSSDGRDHAFFYTEHTPFWDDEDQIAYQAFLEHVVWGGNFNRFVVVAKKYSVGRLSILFEVVFISSLESR